LYLLKVDMLVAAVIFSAAGLMILTLFAWLEAKKYAAAQLRIYRQRASFAKEFAISRRSSRAEGFRTLLSHKISIT